MALSNTFIQILRECSRDEAALQRLVALIEPYFDDQNNPLIAPIAPDDLRSDFHDPRIELANFFAVALDLWCIADLEAHFLKLNPMWETTLGYPLDELIGQRFLDLVHPDDLPATLDALALLRNQQPVLNFTNRYRCKDGSYRYMEWRSQPHGKLIYAAARDITERKQLELDQAQLVAIIESSQEAIVSRDLAGVITSWNRGAEAMYGYTAAEAIGQKMFDLIPPDRIQPVLQNFEVIRKGEYVDHFESTFLHKNGSQRMVALSIAPLFDMEGQVMGGAAMGRDITERKQLEAYQAQLSAIVESSADGIVGRTLDGIITSWNHGAEVIYGYTAQEMLGQSMAILAPPDRIHELAIHLAKVKQGEYVERYETVRLHKNGTRLEVALTISPIKDRAGTVIGVATIHHDIHELKQAQAALRESEARYRAIVTTMTEGIVLQTSDGQIQMCNPAAERITGLSAEQMIGRTSVDPAWRTIHEDFTPFPGETHPAMVALQTGQPVVNVVMGVYKPDDTLSWILINSQPLVKPGAEHPYAVVTSFADITPIRNLEMELRQNAERMRSIFETIEDAIWSVELPNFQMIYINPAGSRISGYPTTAFYEQSDLRAQIVHVDDPAQVQQWRAAILEQGKVDAEYRIVRPDGEIRYVHNRAWLVRDAQGQPYRIEGIASDVTERKVAQEQALQLEIERERAKLLGEFIFNTSHELRTPLTTILIGIYRMIHTNDLAQRQAKGAQLERQVQYLTIMIDQLHEMAKLDRLTELDLRPTPVGRLVQQFIMGYSPRNPTVTVITDVPATSCEIKGDMDYIRLALTQLLDNAVRFSPDRGEVWVRLRVEGQEVLLVVGDQGQGIAPEHLAHIFEHFYKVEAARTHTGNGAGIGLTLVKRIMELHQGRITVQSVVGQGSMFTLHFPLFQS